LHLALVTHRFARGDGQGRVNYEIAKAALGAGHTVSLVASEIAPELAAHGGARAVRIGVAGWPSALLQNQVFAIKSALWLRRHRRELDVVHVNGFTAWARADLNTSHFVHAAWLRSPYHTVRSRKDWYGLYQLLYSYVGARLERWAYRHSSMVVGVSQQVRRELIEAGVDERRLRVIANGVDLEEFKPAQRSRGDLGLPAGVLLLFVGDIKTPRKNLDTLLRALVHTPGATLIVVGDPAGSPYPRLAAELGLSARVQFLGYRKDVAELMKAVDVFVFPSRYEACSLVLLEAAASGLPVVAAKTAGGVELLTPESSVLVDDPDDALELAAVLNGLVTRPATLARMGAAARTAAEANSWLAMAARYLRAYGELGAARAHGAAQSVGAS
jgi:glycosyltransferase involved in cell wall biosynthesis